MSRWLRPYLAMDDERKRAHTKHAADGNSVEGAAWDAPLWLPILVEEVGEVAKELCDAWKCASPDETRALLRGELVQVGAMTAAWIDAIDRMEI